MIEQLASLLPEREVVAGLVPFVVLTSILALGAVAAAAAARVVAALARTKPRPNYGPGPQGILIFGNALELPTENDFLVYTTWAKKWGA